MGKWQRPETILFSKNTMGRPDTTEHSQPDAQPCNGPAGPELCCCIIHCKHSRTTRFFFFSGHVHEPEFQMASDVKNSTNFFFFCPDVSSRYQQTIRNEPNVVGPRMHDQLRMGSDSDPFPIYIRSPEIQKPSRMPVTVFFLDNKMPVTVQCLLRQWIKCNMAKSFVLLKYPQVLTLLLDDQDLEILNRPCSYHRAQT